MQPTRITTECKLDGRPSLTLLFGSGRIRTLQQELSTNGLASTRQLYTTQIHNLLRRHVQLHVSRVRPRGYTRGSQVIVAQHHTRHLDMTTIQLIVRSYGEMVRDFVSSALPLYHVHHGSYVTVTFELPTTLEQDMLNAPAGGGRQLYPRVDYNFRFVNGFELQAHQYRYVVHNTPFRMKRTYLRNHPATEDGTELNFTDVLPFQT